MKLLQFIGKNIRGYINVDITFFQDLNFLIGANGSGKTSILDLINGLLCPAYKIFQKIEYEKIVLILNNDDNKKIKIKSEKSSQKFHFEVQFEKEKPDLIDLDLQQENFFDLVSNDQLFENSVAVKKIRQLKGFRYLAVNRHFSQNNSDIINIDFGRIKNEKETAISYLDDSLQKVQSLVYLAMRKSNANVKALSDRFKTEILKESFSFDKSITWNINFDMENSLQQINNQKIELISIIETYKMKNLLVPCENFFNELEKVVKKLSELKKTEASILNEEYYKSLILWFVNKNMLDKIDRIVKIGRNNADQILKAQNRITRFIQSANSFLKESGKKVSVSPIGEISITLPNGKKRNIYGLSSGEKHLIIILAYLAFSDVLSPVFVVDEPELSLHLAWQQIFVDAIQEANPNAQLIFATHAPAIISKKSRQSNCIDLSEK